LGLGYGSKWVWVVTTGKWVLVWIWVMGKRLGKKKRKEITRINNEKNNNIIITITTTT